LGREPGSIRRTSIRSLSFSLIRCRPAGFGDRQGRARWVRSGRGRPWL